MLQRKSTLRGPHKNTYLCWVRGGGQGGVELSPWLQKKEGAFPPSFGLLTVNNHDHALNFTGTNLTCVAKFGVILTGPY